VAVVSAVSVGVGVGEAVAARVKSEATRARSVAQAHRCAGRGVKSPARGSSPAREHSQSPARDLARFKKGSLGESEAK
jgi:hypothetical protein